MAPGHRERHDIGLLSEDESSLKSETENPQKSSSRFSKYVKGNESDSDENNNNHLRKLNLGMIFRQLKKRQALEVLFLPKVKLIFYLLLRGVKYQKG